MKIRNFCIIAHIDHGKSTLADRILQFTGAITEREAQNQILDTMDLERERGITIKASAVTVHYTHKGEQYMLNLIDTPGHVDFHYEVSRALKACEGALLVVDASQGVEAQTVANAYAAIEQNLEIIPLLNKIDLPAAHPDEVAEEVEAVLGFAAESCIRCSAKSGIGITDVLAAVCENLPGPKGDPNALTQALIFDAQYDDYRGVVIFIRLIHGKLSVGDRIRMMGTGRSYYISTMSKATPKELRIKSIEAGETCYFTASCKSLDEIHIGDTVTSDVHPAAEALAGYREPQRVVFCDFYPTGDSSYEELHKAIDKLHLNDASFTYAPESNEALGFGFRCGFLGLLHMDIIQERLEREGGVTIVQTAPTVTYQIEKTNGEVVEIHNPSELPDVSQIKEIREPMIKVEFILPTENIGDLMKLCEMRRGTYKKQQYLSATRQILEYELPLAEIIYDFYDKLKSMSRGYATMDYDLIGYHADRLDRVDVLVNGKAVEALSFICHRDKAELRSRVILKKLKEEIDRHQFEIPLQAAIGGKVIARETIKSVGKNVLAKCYGGDVSRKRKLLEKQKEGKKRMKRVGSVDIPQTAFMAVLESGE
jgi:GTP-binding protein LepA